MTKPLMSFIGHAVEDYLAQEGVSRPEWDDYFVSLTEVVKTRSTDAETKTGCVICSGDHKIISTGYNAFPRGCDDDNLPTTRPAKYDFIEHADRNALYNTHADLTGTVMYLPFHPCIDCFRGILQNGIKEVRVYGKYSSGGTLFGKNKSVDILSEQSGVRIITIPGPKTC